MDVAKSLDTSGTSGTSSVPKAPKPKTLERHYFDSLQGLEGSLYMRLMRYNPTHHERMQMYRWIENYTNSQQAYQAARRVTRMMQNVCYGPGRGYREIDEVWEVTCESGVQIELGMTKGGRWYLKVVQMPQPHQLSLPTMEVAHA